MSRRTRTSRSRASRGFPTIHPAILDQVIGGQFAPRTTLDPVIAESVASLSQAIQSVGQNLAAAKQNSTQQLMQIIQQFMQGRNGG